MREIGSKVVEKVDNVSNAVICTISAIYGSELPKNPLRKGHVRAIWQV